MKITNHMVKARLERFKEEFHFTPNLDDENLGRIYVDGKSYWVDLDIYSSTVKVPVECKAGYEEITRVTCAPIVSKRRCIIFSLDTFRLPYPCIVSVLYHEIGHIELHNPFAGRRCCDERRTEMFDVLYHSALALSNPHTMRVLGRYGVSHDDLVVTFTEDDIVQAMLPNRKRNAREEARRYADELAERLYGESENWNLANELEADRYSINRTSALCMGTALVLTALMVVGRGIRHLTVAPLAITLKHVICRLQAFSNKSLVQFKMYQ